ncbi:hypothetical protein GCK32_021875, partial [Trichostrongylus colubriformis]
GIHIYGTSLMTFSHSSFQQVKPWGHILLSAFIGMYGMNTALLTLHFVYRYIAVCRQKFSRLFEETTSVTVITGSLFLWGSFYFFVTFYCFAATEDYYRYAGLSVDATFGTDIRELSFFCIFTHVRISEADRMEDEKCKKYFYTFRKQGQMQQTFTGYQQSVYFSHYL